MKVKAIGKIAFDAVYEANAERVYRTALHYSDNNHYPYCTVCCIERSNG